MNWLNQVYRVNWMNQVDEYGKNSGLKEISLSGGKGEEERKYQG